jgi:hypothetical protein
MDAAGEYQPAKILSRKLPRRGSPILAGFARMGTSNFPRLRLNLVVEAPGGGKQLSRPGLGDPGFCPLSCDTLPQNCFR